MTESVGVDREYQCSPTLYEFHASDDFVRGAMGPIGSGKSVACVIEIMRRAAEQRPNAQKVRRTRWAVIRNSFGELRDTTIKTFHDWVPPTGNSYPRKWISTEFNYRIRDKLDDGTTMDCEILFRPLDRPDQVKKLLSLELTGAWVNEAREVPRAVVNALLGRVGRFPSAREEGCGWYGVIMDTNPPDTDHWWYDQFEERRPEGWKLVQQPSGRGPDAENLRNLPSRYYANLIGSNLPDWIKVYVDGHYGYVRDGKPVFPEYNDEIHCAKSPIPFDPNRPLLMGQDFGLTPAAVFAQVDIHGRWRIINELVSDDVGIDRFCEQARPWLVENFPGLQPGQIKLWGDPAGTQKAQTDEKTCFQIMRAHGFDPQPGPTQNPTIRREAVASPMGRLIVGQPGFLISPTCTTLRKGLMGGYCYKRLKVSDERYQDHPDKNLYSHVADALQYLMCGGGEAHALVSSRQTRQESWDPLAAAKKAGYGAGKQRSSWVTGGRR